MIKRFSLLWPDISKKSYSGKGMKSGYIKDLGVDTLIEKLTNGSSENHVFYQALGNLCTDIDVLNYRLDVMDDFMKVKNIDNTVYYVLDSITNRKNNAKNSYKTSTFIKIDTLIRNIIEYLNAVNIAYNMLSNLQYDSSGMNTLINILKDTIDSPFHKYFSQFGNDLAEANNNPEFMAFNMNLGLLMNYKKVSLYDLFTLKNAKKSVKDSNQKYHAIHMNYMINDDIKEIFNTLRDDFYEKLYAYFNELDKNLSNVEYELSYYLTMSRTFKQLKNININICRPVFRNMDEKLTYIKNGYDPLLVLQLYEKNMTGHLVANDSNFSKDCLSFVVTGVNQGGKTTWLRMNGLTHVMAQAGLYVLAGEAVISPVDNILTVYASGEKGELGHGKLAEDFIKINEMFKNVTGDSLVLLNEALSSTSQDDAAYLITEYIKIFNDIGCRNAFVTHFIKVANKINETRINQGTSIKLLLSAVQKINNEKKRTYRIEEGQINAENLLTDLATKEGISYEQLLSGSKN